MFNRHKELLIRSAEAGTLLQRKNGSLPAGHNNTWKDDDTPVRCTAHFVIQFLFAYQWTNQKSFAHAARKGLEYLCSPEARPYGYTFFCRKSETKSKSNGLIGQAWAMEACLFGHDVFGDQEFLDLPYTVYCLHDFHRHYGLYSTCEIDGKKSSVARTLNHQLIFTAASMRLWHKGREDVGDHLKRFFMLLPRNICLRNDGLIHHHVRLGRNRLERKTFEIASTFHRRKIIDRSQGYQSFNLFALALAKRNFPQAPVWGMSDLQSLLQPALDYALQPAYLSSVLNNPFALAYRLTGFEILFFKRIFSLPGEEHGIRELVDVQIRRHWNDQEGLLNRDTGDPATLSSRFYEAGYLFEDVPIN